MKKVLLALAIFNINNAFAASYQTQSLDNDLKIIEENTRELSEDLVNSIKKSHIDKLNRMDKYSLQEINKYCKSDLANICSGNNNKINCMHFNLNKIKDRTCKSNINRRTGEYQIFKEETTINGIKFPKGSFIIQKDYTTEAVIRVGTLSFVKERGIYYSDNIYIEDGLVKDSGLAFPQRVNGILYGGKNFIFNLNENNIVTVGMLAEDSLINNILAPKDTVVRRFDSGKLQSIINKEPIIIYGVKFKERKGISFDKQNNLIFSSTSRTDDKPIITKIDKYELISAQYNSTIEVYPNGKLKSGVLAKEYIINGQKFPDYTFIELSDDGKVLKHRAIKKPKPKIKKGDSFKIPLVSMIIDGEVNMWTQEKEQYPILHSVESALDGLSKGQSVTKIVNAYSTITAVKELEDNVYLFKDNNGNLFRQYVFNNEPHFYTNSCNSNNIYKCKDWANILSSCQNKICSINITVPLIGQDNMIMYNKIKFDKDMYNRSKKEIINILKKYNIKYKTLKNSNTLVIYGNSITLANLLINSNNLFIKYINLMNN